MYFRFSVPLLLAAGLAAAAGDSPDLTGGWELDAARSQNAARIKSSSLTIEHKPDRIRIQESAVPVSGKPDNTQLDCGTLGKPCDFVDDGQPAQVTMWHNGATLVVMELRGKNHENVIKRRFSLSADGKLLTEELIRITPTEKAETLVFTRKPQPGSKEAVSQVR